MGYPGIRFGAAQLSLGEAAQAEFPVNPATRVQKTIVEKRRRLISLPAPCCESFGSLLGSIMPWADLGMDLIRLHLDGQIPLFGKGHQRFSEPPQRSVFEQETRSLRRVLSKLAEKVRVNPTTWKPYYWDHQHPWYQ